MLARFFNWLFGGPIAEPPVVLAIVPLVSPAVIRSNDGEFHAAVILDLSIVAPGPAAQKFARLALPAEQARRVAEVIEEAIVDAECRAERMRYEV